MTDLYQRIDDGAVIILDGAIGTQLQAMSVPMDNTAWAAAALHSHPYTVRRMHELYIEAGVDIITTNTYASARHNLEPLGLADSSYELNLRAVALAQEARARSASTRPVYIAGSVSNFGLIVGGEPTQALHRHSRQRSEITAQQAQANLHEQAQILAQSGVDFLLVESTGSNTQRKWVLDACLATGLPTWLGFKAHKTADNTLNIGFESSLSLADGIAELSASGATVLNLFHTTADVSSDALSIIKQHWHGPIGFYPDAGRSDYTATWRDDTVATATNPEAFLALAQQWVANGVQIIGGCCGFELDYIRCLRDGLPSRIPSISD